MSDLHETFARDLALGFNGPTNQKLYRAIGRSIGDRTLEDAQSMVEESLPLQASAAANGLTANDRVLVRGPAESDASFAARLVAYRDQWRLAGAPLGLLIQLHYAGFEQAVVVQQNGLGHYLQADPDLEELAVWVAAWQARAPIAGPSFYAQALLDNRNPPIPASADGKPALAALSWPWWVFDAGMDAEGNQFCGRFAVLFPSDAPAPGLGTASTLARARRVVAEWRPSFAYFIGFYVCSVGRFVGWPPRDIDTATDVGPGTVTFYAGE